MRLGITALLLLALAGCASKSDGLDFTWPRESTAIPDEHTAIMISLAIYQSQLKISADDPNELAPKMKAFRYRLSDLARDPNGDAWFVEPIKGTGCDNCLGGNLYTMVLSAHDGRVLEFYLPE